MDSHQKSIESQLRTRCDILESQVETLEKQNSYLLKELALNRANENLPFKVSQTVKTGQWKEILGVGIFPKNYITDFLDYD